MVQPTKNYTPFGFLQKSLLPGGKQFYLANTCGSNGDGEPLVISQENQAIFVDDSPMFIQGSIPICSMVVYLPTKLGDVRAKCW
jgi:hypothetical protein